MRVIFNVKCVWYMWPDQAERNGCQKFWFLDTFNYYIQFLLYILCKMCMIYVTRSSWKRRMSEILISWCIQLLYTIPFVSYCNVTCNKSSIDMGVFGFWKLLQLSLQPYLKLTLEQGRQVTRSAWSGHIYAQFQSNLRDAKLHIWILMASCMVLYNMVPTWVLSLE